MFLGALSHEEGGGGGESLRQWRPPILFFFPSTAPQNTLGNVVLEAQVGRALPVVRLRPGRTSSQHMLAEDTGFVCAAGDADAFARAVTVLLTQPHRRLAMSRRARQHAENRDWPSAALTPLVEAWQIAARRRVRVSDRRKPG